MKRGWWSAPGLALVSVSTMAAVGGAGPAAPDPLFASHGELAIRLSVPLRALSGDRSDDPKYRAGRLSLVEPDGAEQTFEIKVRSRGRSRRDKDVCAFPPLRLNFRKSELAGTVFDGQDKLKLVTHCRPSPRHQRYVFREYLAYRLLNQLTDASFQVRPLQVTYLNSERTSRPLQRFGFFIEDQDRAAKRLGLRVAEVGGDGIDPGRLEPRHTSLMELFQFMIGNTDFAFIAGAAGDGCCHNAVLLETAEGRYRPLPFDFDISGIVNPPYAVVDYRLPLHSVRQRLFRGFCRDPAVLEAAVARFRSTRASMFEVVAAETALEQRDRADLRAYLEDFFAILDDPETRRRRIERVCRR